jgi:hypothetical protein
MTTVRAFWRGISIPQLLLFSAVCVYAVTFVLLYNFGRPGLGLSGGFYVAVILVAAATSPLAGVGAALAAVLLLVVAGLHGHQLVWADFDNAPVLTHLAGYSAAGLLTGFLALRSRRMLAQSLYVLEDLIEIAHDREPERAARTLPTELTD